jgi:hypothetical protein
VSSHFSGNRKYLYEFSDLFLVHCPRCDRCARVVPFETKDEIKPPNKGTAVYYKLVFAPHRLTCEYCGYVKEWTGKRIAPTEGRDWYFDCPLWLQGPCCGEVLWAFNPRHLQFLEDFVRADFRETHYNASLASRLPEGMKLGKNREEVLRCVKKVRDLLVSG